MQRHAFLPLPTYPEINSDAIVANAVGVAACLQCDLHVTAMNPHFPIRPNAVARLLTDLPEVIERTERECAERGKDLCDKLAQEAGKLGVTIHVGTARHNSTDLPDFAARQARYFDYALCGWESGSETARMTAEALIFGSGRPTVLLPELHEFKAVDHVAIAWDGSRVAARAAADAEHLLGRAGRITVLTVRDEKPLDDPTAGERLVAALERHGFVATGMPIDARSRPIAAALQEEALERGASVLVMGAFGHSRMRDFVLGGATRGVLADLRLPVMLSH